MSNFAADMAPIKELECECDDGILAMDPWKCDDVAKNVMSITTCLSKTRIKLPKISVSDYQLLLLLVL